MRAGLDADLRSSALKRPTTMRELRLVAGHHGRRERVELHRAEGGAESLPLVQLTVTPRRARPTLRWHPLGRERGLPEVVDRRHDGREPRSLALFVDRARLEDLVHKAFELGLRALLRLD